MALHADDDARQAVHARVGPLTPGAEGNDAPAGRSTARPRLCVAMATHEDFDGVYFTIQAMRLGHPEVLAETTFLVLDNDPGGVGSEALRRFAAEVPEVRYVPFDGFRGTAVRDLLFRESDAEIVLCVDSHVIVRPGGLRALLEHFRSDPRSQDLIQGPLLGDGLDRIVATHMSPTWGAGMFGQWAVDERAGDPSCPPFEIPMQGLGLFACRREAWPGLNSRLRGFGGEEGYLHEKVRRQGGRTLCLPALAWAHRFKRPGGITYPLVWADVARNYEIGWAEVGWDTAAMRAHLREHLGSERAERAFARVRREVDSPLMFFDAILCLDGDAGRWHERHEALARLDIGWRVERVRALATDDEQRVDPASFRSLIATAKHRGYANALIVGDGVRFADGASADLAAVVSALGAEAWDLLCLAGSERSGPDAPGAARDAVREIGAGLPSTDAIAVSARAFDRLLDDLPMRKRRPADGSAPLSAGRDHWLQTLIGEGGYRALTTSERLVQREPVVAGAGERARGTGASRALRWAAAGTVVLDLAGFGVRIRVIDTTDQAVADRLGALAPPELIGPAGDGAREYVVAADRRGGISVAGDGQVRYRAATASDVVSWLRGEIDDTVAFGATDALFMHAGVVGWRDRAILLPGRSGTGKTSLVAELVRCGATYYSDDSAPIDAQGRVHPYARMPSPKRAAAGPRVIDEPARLQSRPPLPVALTVLTSYQPGVDWQPRVLGGGRAVLALLDHIVMAREQPPRSLATAKLLAATGLTVVGTRPEASETAARVLAHLDAILDGDEPPAADDPGTAPMRRTQPVRPRSRSDPPDAQRVANIVAQMRVDGWTGEVLTAFADRRIRPILLKGPATVRWLYPDDPHLRSYCDADLLVAPEDWPAARAVLAECGFTEQAYPRLEADSHALTFVRDADDANVDLHRSLHGMLDLPSPRVWEAAVQDAGSMVVGGVGVAVLGPAMRLLHVALHLGAEGPGDRAWIDLTRAFAVSTHDDWEATISLAERLGIAHELAARLRLRAEAASLLARLGPQPPAMRYHLENAVRTGTAPGSILSIDRLLAADGIGARARYAARRFTVGEAKLGPAGRFVASRGWGLGPARTVNAVAIAAKLPGAIAAWRRERRRLGRRRDPPAAVLAGAPGPPASPSR